MSRDEPRVVGPPAERYFSNVWLDSFAIGGVSILVFVVLKVLVATGVHTGERTETVWTTAYVLSWVVNWPHFAATNYRLYSSRRNLSQYPVTALVVPILVIAGVAGALAAPLSVAPYWVKLFLLWSPYHFSGQTLGIGLVYARRNGFVVSRLERLSLSGFIYGTFITQTARAEAGLHDAPYFGVSYPSLNIPTWIADWTYVGMWFSGALLAALIVRRLLRTGEVMPPIVLLPAITQYVWYIEGADVPSFVEFVPFFHSLQYLFIAWYVHLKERLDEGQAQPSRRYVLLETSRWGAINFAGGAALFWALPHAVADLGIADLGVSMATVVAGVQIHHFFVDGVIWKLKGPGVRSPLTSSLSQVLGETPAPRRAMAA